MSHLSMPAKLLICFMERHRGELLVAAAKKAGARGGTIAPGQSLARSRILQALSLADVRQDVVFTIMGAESEAVLPAVKAAAEKEPKKLGGMGLLLTVPSMYVRDSGQSRAEVLRGSETRSGRMESGYTLITVIVNSGYAEAVMAAARGAGASGGSILNARGTGTEEDVKFFGITLVPEKEMLLIVSENEKVAAIVEAVSGVETLNKPGGGVLFTMNVDEFILLGQQKTWGGDGTK